MSDEPLVAAPVVVPPTDLARDARVAARRAADARRAGRALDALLADQCTYPMCNQGGAVCGRNACVERKRSEYGE
jgi:hypothetical protein